MYAELLADKDIRRFDRNIPDPHTCEQQLSWTLTCSDVTGRLVRGDHVITPRDWLTASFDCGDSCDTTTHDCRATRFGTDVTSTRCRVGLAFHFVLLWPNSYIQELSLSARKKNTKWTIFYSSIWLLLLSPSQSSAESLAMCHESNVQYSFHQGRSE